jgi:hypothetical protein
MRQDLDDFLCARYPALYAERNLDAGLSCMARGFPGDGWFAILDAVSEVLTLDAASGGYPLEPARQVKEKFGTLRFYVEASPRGRGALDLAEEMSARVCEETGRQGRLGRLSGYYMTRAPGVVKGFVGFGDTDRAGRTTVPTLGFSAADMLSLRTGVLAGPVEVPQGWLDLVDGMLRLLSSDPEDGEAAVTVSGVRVSEGALRVDHAGGGARAEGVVAMAVALSRRIDLVSGASIIPVGGQEPDAGPKARG